MLSEQSGQQIDYNTPQYSSSLVCTRVKGQLGSTPLRRPPQAADARTRSSKAQRYDAHVPLSHGRARLAEPVLVFG
jgi:hypothetical protein